MKGPSTMSGAQSNSHAVRVASHDRVRTGKSSYRWCEVSLDADVLFTAKHCQITGQANSPYDGRQSRGHHLAKMGKSQRAYPHAITAFPGKSWGGAAFPRPLACAFGNALGVDLLGTGLALLRGNSGFSNKFGRDGFR
jgi:hypothetical protein